MRIIRARAEEPASQTHEEIYSSSIGFTVTAVTTTYKDGKTEFAVYLDSEKNADRFECIGVYDDTLAGEIQCQNTASVVRRVLEAIEEMREGA